MKKIILIVIVLAAGVALGIYFQREPKAEKIETTIQTDASQARTDIKAGEQKIETAATTIKTNIEAGVHKSEKIATNVAAHVKADAQKAGEVVTNAVAEIKNKLP